MTGYFFCHFDGRRTEKSASTEIQDINEKDASLHCVSLCMTGSFMSVISMDVGLRNLYKKEFRVFNEKIFRLRYATLNMTVSDCHSDKLVISMDRRLRNLLKEEFKMLKNKKTMSV